MGFHHFHLGNKVEAAGHIERTDDLIFARVTRSEFVVIAIFDHDVFEPGTAERQRLFQVQEDRIAQVAVGEFVLLSNIALSGHPIFLVRHAQACVRIIRNEDSLLDDTARVAEIYQRLAVPMPKKPKLEWDFKGLDFGLGEKKAGTFGILNKGWA
jgi:hypothetical protein